MMESRALKHGVLCISVSSVDVALLHAQLRPIPNGMQ